MVNSKLTTRCAWQLAGVAFFAAIFAVEAQASCGDYLLHGPVLNVDLMKADSAATSGQHAPTACENGKCQQSPQSFPQEPPRVLVPKQLATVLRFASSMDQAKFTLLCRRDVIQPESPFLEIESPPPQALGKSHCHFNG